MNNKFFYTICFFGSLALFSCSGNTADKKATESIKDTVETGGSGNGAKDSSGNNTMADTSKKVMHYVPGTKKIVDTVKAMGAAKTGKKIKDTAGGAISRVQNADQKKNDAVPASAVPDKTNAVKANSPATDKPAAPLNNTATAAGPEAPFVPKYGIVPRNATETNITVFLGAFPDKTTRIRVNFDSAPDAEMTQVKAQIIKVLKNTGYTNVSDQSATVEPRRMPKEIHYELQHDGSVVIWVQPATTQQ